MTASGLMGSASSPGGILNTATGVPDAALETIWRYLVDVRDGGVVPAHQSSTGFGSSTVSVAGTIQTFTITNERGVNANFASVPTSSNATEFAVLTGVSGGTCPNDTATAIASSCTVKVQFTPNGTSARAGTLRFTLNSPAGVTAQQRSFSLTGTGIAAPALSVSPATSAGLPANFSSHLNIASAPSTWTLSNSGGGTITLGAFSIPANYAMSGTSACTNGFVLPTTAASCTVVLVYTPTAVGTVASQVSIAHSAAGSPARIFLSGTGIGDPLLTLGSVTPPFLVTLIGHPRTASVTVTNAGTAAGTVGTVGIAPGGLFTQTNGCDGATLAPGGTCTINVTFPATAAGLNQTATLMVPDGSGLTATSSLVASVRQLATIPALPTPMQASLGASSTATVQISNPSGVSTFLGSVALSGSTDFVITSNTCAATLAGGATCNLGITFTPTSTTGVASTLTVRYGPSAGLNAAQNISVPLSGSTQLLPVISVTPPALNFPATLPGTTASLFVDIGNTGNAALALASVALTANLPPDFAITANTCGASIAAGAPSCRVTLSFTPSTQAARTASLVVTHNASGGSTTVPLSGTTLLRPLATLSPTTLDFSSVVIATPSPRLTTTLTNTGNIDLHLSAIAITGAQAGDFAQSGSTCTASTTLAPASACQVSLVFTPGATGARGASLQISHDAAGSPSAVTLLGLGALAPAPDIQTNQSALAYAPQVVHTAGTPQVVTLLNSGTAALNLGAISTSGAAAADFSIDPSGAGACAVSVPLAVGASCTISVAFTPSAIGTRSAALVIASNASRGTVTLPVSGTGQPVPAPAAIFTPSALNFGPQTVGGLYLPGVVQLQNSGNAVMNIAGIAVSGAGYTVSHNCTTALAVGAVCQINIAFTAAAAGTSYPGQLAVSSDAPGSPQWVPLSGTGTAATVPVLTWSPVVASLAFGNVSVGSGSPVQSLVLLNQGPGGALLNVINATGASAAEFSLTGTCTPGSVLPQGQSCRIDVMFVPGSAGAKAANVQVASTGSRPADVTLAGNGLGGPTPDVALSLSALSFDVTRVGAQSLPAELTLTATGSGVAQVLAMTMSGPYAVQVKTCPALPFKLLAGASCTMTVTFQPQAEGDAAGVLGITSDASPTPHQVALSGSGQAKADVSSGGCSLTDGESLADPTLWLLALAALAALGYRRALRREARR